MEAWPPLRDRILDEAVLAARWRRRLTQANPIRGVHLAVLRRHALEDIFSESKWVEVRFTKTRCAPHGRIVANDIVLLKASGGHIEGVALDKVATTLERERRSVRALRALCEGGDGHGSCYDEFWAGRRPLEYRWISLIHLTAVQEFHTRVRVIKHDQRSWVVLHEHR